MTPPRSNRSRKKETRRKAFLHTVVATATVGIVLSTLILVCITNRATEGASTPTRLRHDMLNLQLSRQNVVYPNASATHFGYKISPRMQFDVRVISNRVEAISAQGETQRIPTLQSPVGGAFVHLGKTGGSALSSLLRNGCHSWSPHPCRNVTDETMASRLITSYYHVPDFGLLRQSNHDFYFITLRDPFDRVISAFVFEHIINRRARGEPVENPVLRDKLERAYQCFPSLEAYVGFLKGDSLDFSYPYHQAVIVDKSCKNLARAALHGKVRPFNHFFFNYRRIFSLLPKPESQIFLVTRQENLWEDWERANVLLGQEEPVIIPADLDFRAVRNTTTLTLPVTRGLSADGRQTLCTALEHEYYVFFWILRRARNIQSEHLQQSIEKAKVNCPKLPYTNFV